MQNQLSLFWKTDADIAELYAILTTIQALLEKSPILAMEYIVKLKQNLVIASFDLSRIKDEIQIALDEQEWKKILEEYQQEKKIIQQSTGAQERAPVDC